VVVEIARLGALAGEQAPVQPPRPEGLTGSEQRLLCVIVASTHGIAGEAGTSACDALERRPDRDRQAPSAGVDWELLGEREIGDEARTLLGRPTPCVGRDRELRTLLDLVEECAAESIAHAVLVTAPAGARDPGGRGGRWTPSTRPSRVIERRCAVSAAFMTRRRAFRPLDRVHPFSAPMPARCSRREAAPELPPEARPCWNERIAPARLRAALRAVFAPNPQIPPS
jgi:hypothetical protein